MLRRGTPNISHYLIDDIRGFLVNKWTKPLLGDLNLAKVVLKKENVTRFTHVQEGTKNQSISPIHLTPTHVRYDVCRRNVDVQFSDSETLREKGTLSVWRFEHRPSRHASKD